MSHSYQQALAVLCSGHVYAAPARSLEPKPKPKRRDYRNKHERRENALTAERVADAARIYGSNNEAAAALGCSPGSFSRACRDHGIETPRVRRRREYWERR